MMEKILQQLFWLKFQDLKLFILLQQLPWQGFLLAPFSLISLFSLLILILLLIIPSLFTIKHPQLIISLFPALLILLQFYQNQLDVHRSINNQFFHLWPILHQYSCFQLNQQQERHLVPFLMAILVKLIYSKYSYQVLQSQFFHLLQAMNQLTWKHHHKGPQH